MIEISSDIDAAMRDCVAFFGDQVPFAFARALTDSAFDVRRQIVEVTFNRDFEVRNKSFAKALWKVGKKAKKSDLTAEVTQALDRDFIERHTTGGTKTPRGSVVAIPINPKGMRGSKGAIKKSEKPRNLKNSYVRNVNGTLIVFEKKRGKESTAKYVLKKSAKIDRTFEFYEDAEAKAIEVFSGHFSDNMLKAIVSSRFFP